MSRAPHQPFTQLFIQVLVGQHRVSLADPLSFHNAALPLSHWFPSLNDATSFDFFFVVTGSFCAADEVTSRLFSLK